MKQSLKLLPVFLLLIIWFVAGCSETTHSTPLGANAVAQAKQFKSYWGRGEAELSRYALKQARYGQVHPGEAVLVFVTEEFLRTKQVKYEGGDRSDAVSILKLNLLKKFPTGVYDYSMMSSVFTPVDFHSRPRSLKVTTTSQEWCGHTFTQLNLRRNSYEARWFSYFMNEGDQRLELPVTHLEDDLWTRLRISPRHLPVGEFRMLPSSMYIRLLHKKMEPRKARAEITAYKPGHEVGMKFRGTNLKVYSLTYPEDERRLWIVYEDNMPYKILGWRESYKSGFGPGARSLNTEARLTHSIMSDYWNRNSLKDMRLKKKLGIKYY